MPEGFEYNGEPVANRTIEYWYGGDSYTFIPQGDGEYNLRYLGPAGQERPIRYHVSFPQPEFTETVPPANTGHYTSGEDLTGYPGGVFSVENKPSSTGTYPQGEGRFYAIYYWGAGAISSDPSHAGELLIYFSNAWYLWDGPNKGPL